MYINATARGWEAHNWTWASKKLYISGNGTEIDPYYIQGVTFNGTETVGCVTIENSRAYFIIESCILKNIGGPDGGYAGIKLINTTLGKLVDNSFSTTKPDVNYGIHLDSGSKNNTIVDNDLNTDFSYGIYLENGCEKNNITGNTVNSNKIGIYFNNQSSTNNITGNIIQSNELYGIYLNDSCNSNYITYNAISDTDDSGTGGDGIKIDTDCLYNKIVGNNLTNNNNIGVLILNSSFGYSKYNEIYRNNFIGNSLHAKDDDRDNMWDDSIKGNYKDNYTDLGLEAVDADDDGIGDIPYNITGNANSTDYKPIWDDGHNRSKIHIDGRGYNSYNWQWAVTRTWCSGNGTVDDPYVIENVVINGTKANGTIFIEWSSLVFKIKNCTLFEALDSGIYPNKTAGIYLYKTSNGTIINNTCRDNGDHGIFLNSSNNNVIKENVIKDNADMGIFLAGNSHDNVILDNRLYRNGINGIHLKCEENVISKNLIDNSGDPGGWGIVLQFSGNNTLFDNTILYNDVGIHLFMSSGNDIISNTVNFSNLHGINFEGFCDNNNISYNTIYQSVENGINFGWPGTLPCHNNTITENYLLENFGFGLYLQQCFATDISENTITGNNVGIGVAYNSMGNNFTKNTIENSDEHGLIILQLGCKKNRIFGNEFLDNGINAGDVGRDNNWYVGTLGNYWKDYSGEDKDDNNRGDTPYQEIDGWMNSEDEFPIYWDGPVASVINPIADQEFATNPPPFKVKVIEGESYFFWYTLNNSDPYGLLDLPGSLDEEINGFVDNNLWGSFSNGEITIRFYVNDSRGEFDYQEVVVIKNIGGVPSSPPKDDDEDDEPADEDDEPADKEDDAAAVEDEGLPWWLQAMFTGMISASAGLIIKITYSTQKKRKELLRNVTETFDKIENIEEFLKEKLNFEEWQKFQEPWEKYLKNEIDSKSLIKRGRKFIGKPFVEIFLKPRKKRIERKAEKTRLKRLKRLGRKPK